MARLRSFTEAQQRDGPLNRLPPRLTAIEVRRIIGSVSQPKIETLTSAFLSRADRADAPRYRAILAAMQRGTPLPPIEVYALREAYYVVDGHHRVAAARALGMLYLDAVAHEFTLPATNAANRRHNERRHFERLTGLAEVVVTAPGQYPKLLAQVREHRFFLGQAGRVVGMDEAAQAWKTDVYAPVTAWLAQSGVPAHFPGRTPADLYVYLCDYKWMQSQRAGRDIGFPRALADFQQLYPPRSPVERVAARVRQLVDALLRTVQSATWGLSAHETGGELSAHEG